MSSAGSVTRGVPFLYKVALKQRHSEGERKFKQPVLQPGGTIFQQVLNGLNAKKQLTVTDTTLCYLSPKTSWAAAIKLQVKLTPEVRLRHHRIAGGEEKRGARARGESIVSYCLLSLDDSPSTPHTLVIVPSLCTCEGFDHLWYSCGCYRVLAACVTTF